MKGIIFTEFVEMVEQSYSPEIADAIIEESQVPSGGVYTAVGTYPAAELMTLVQSLSEHVDTPVPDLLNAFGRHLFGQFATQHPEFFLDGQDPLDFLAGIEDVVHSEVRKLYPDAQLPTFTVERNGADELVMVYRSPRRLADLADGLLHGALAHFATPAEVRRELLEPETGVTEFTVLRHSRVQS